MNKQYFKVGIGIMIAVLVGFALILSGGTKKNKIGNSLGSIDEGTYKYQQTSTTSTEKDIINNSAVLHRIIVGTSDTAGYITLIDSATPITSSTTVFHIAGDTLKGVYEVGAYFANGIMAIVSQSDVTFIFSPR